MPYEDWNQGEILESVCRFYTDRGPGGGTQSLLENTTVPVKRIWQIDGDTPKLRFER